MGESWPRTYHLLIVQQSPAYGNFRSHIIDAIQADCITIISHPEPAGTAKGGRPKWRGCRVEVRDIDCMAALTVRLQTRSILCRPRRDA